MGFDIKLTFPKTKPRPKAEILARTKEVHRLLSRAPRWMIGCRRAFIKSCIFPRNAKDVPFEFTRDYYAKGPNDFRKENRKSSDIHLTNMFVFPVENVGIDVFQLFCKTKERQEVKQVWEYLMLDSWSHLLRYYSQVSQVTLTAPQSFKLEENELYMEYKGGTIGDRLHNDFKSSLEVPLTFGRLTLYQAFALHLGALAHVKEAEELSHGDFQLRHFIFDPGGLIGNILYYAKAVAALRRELLTRPSLFEVNQYLSKPSLTVIDIEHSLRQPAPLVREENENLLMKARGYATSHGLKVADFEKAYREGYDRIDPQDKLPELIQQQHERYGVSIDNLF